VLVKLAWFGANNQLLPMVDTPVTDDQTIILVDKCCVKELRSYRNRKPRRSCKK
jgi:hypothetical protein